MKRPPDRDPQTLFKRGVVPFVRVDDFQRRFDIRMDTLKRNAVLVVKRRAIRCVASGQLLERAPQRGDIELPMYTHGVADVIRGALGR